MRSHWLIALLSLALIAATRADDAVDKDVQAFQGAWTLHSLERDGKKTPEAEARKLRLTIRGHRFTLRKQDDILSEGSFVLDPGRRPKTIDETISSGPNKGKTYLAIYEIDDHEHRICFAAFGQKRPAGFAAPAGSGQLLQVWKRAKK